MDLVTGALRFLPSKLMELVEEYKMPKGVRQQVLFLTKELERMHIVLRKVEAVPRDQLDEQDKVSARLVREASYNMEDILDTFLVHVDSQDHADPRKLNHAVKKMGDLFNKGKARREISNAIEDIKKQVRELTERCIRFRVDDIVTNSASSSSYDPRHTVLYTQVSQSQLVGIEESFDMVTKMLISDGKDMEMKIVSIVGFAGLGKTTLAKVVYEILKDNFRFKAFVPVGPNPDLKKVLRDILIGLDKSHYYSNEFNVIISDEMQLVHELQEFLKDKRYFIVIDDIWDVPSWDIIRSALCDNSFGSKIVITTRKHDVAMKVGCSYNMRPLSAESSLRLFYGRIFGSEYSCPVDLEEISHKILRKCGGVPLAIITASSMLANKPTNRHAWYEYYVSIGSGLGHNHDMENMRKILSLSYYDLPAHLKTCLVYLCGFPENFVIKKDNLIWKWIAEGFIPESQGIRLSEIGEGYFHDLLNRSIIQAVMIKGMLGLVPHRKSTLRVPNI